MHHRKYTIVNSISIKNTKLTLVSASRGKELGSYYFHHYKKKKLDQLKIKNFSWIYQITEVARQNATPVPTGRHIQKDMAEAAGATN